MPAQTELHPWLDPFLRLSDAVIITDQEHNVLAVNESYEHITGYGKSEVVGRPAGMLKSGHTPLDTYRMMKETLQGGRSWSGIFTNRKKDHSLWHSSITVTPFTIERSLYYVGIFRELERLDRGQYLPEDRIRTLQSSLVRLLAVCSEIRDPGIEGHLVRVQKWTGMLGEEYFRKMSGGSPHDRTYLQYIVDASILHDIGKSGVPEGILYKPDALASFERKIVEMHPVMGVEILKKIETDLDEQLLRQELAVARNIILHHHERWDGNGYPHGLAGDRIPLEARIVGIVDVYDALTSKRPYKDAWSSSEALDYMCSMRGSQFDPELTDLFVAAMGQGAEGNLPDVAGGPGLERH